MRAPKGRLSPQDMQEQQERDFLLLQVNRLHNSVHYDSSSLPDDPAVDAVGFFGSNSLVLCPSFTPRCLLWVLRLGWVCFRTYLSHLNLFCQAYGIVVLHGSNQVYREP